MLINKKIYISGCGGMLGKAFYDHFKINNQLKCSDIDTNETLEDVARLGNTSAKMLNQDLHNYLSF